MTVVFSQLQNVLKLVILDPFFHTNMRFFFTPGIPVSKCNLLSNSVFGDIFLHDLDNGKYSFLWSL